MRMKVRLVGVGVIALVALAVAAAPATAQQVGPDDGGSQVDQYVGGGGQGGGNPEADPGVGGGGEVGGGGGQLPFTGLAVLSLALVGIALLLVGPVLRRRAADRSTADAI
jgi:Spy/CpxP family protein refolding chaperone